MLRASLAALCAVLMVAAASGAEITTGYKTIIRTGEGEIPLGAVLDIKGLEIYPQTETVRLKIVPKPFDVFLSGVTLLYRCLTLLYYIKYSIENSVIGQCAVVETIKCLAQKGHAVQTYQYIEMHHGH